MLHKKYVNRGFTLVELLSVIVILAIILVIAVPKIMSVITDSKKSSLETSAKMIASTAEKTKVQKELLGEEITGEVDCSEFTKVTSDYETCTVKFDGNTAKVNITGSGKFEGLSICNADKNSATAQEEDCPVPVSFTDDSWETIIAAVKIGDYPYQVGDTKEVELTGFTNEEEGSNGLYTLRVANTTPCSEVSLESETACGFVLEFADIITTYNMNPSGEYNGTTYSYGWSKDGFPASSMYSYLNVLETEGSGIIYNSLPEELRNAIIGTKVISSHGSEDTSNFTTEDVKLYLLSTREVWGEEIKSCSLYCDLARGDNITRQLDYYANNSVSTSNKSGAIKKLNGEAEMWWLRAATSHTINNFFGVYSSGGLSYTAAIAAVGVSPAFRLSD